MYAGKKQDISCLVLSGVFIRDVSGEGGGGGGGFPPPTVFMCVTGCGIDY